MSAGTLMNIAGFQPSCGDACECVEKQVFVFPENETSHSPVSMISECRATCLSRPERGTRRKAHWASNEPTARSVYQVTPSRIPISKSAANKPLSLEGELSEKP